MALDLHNRPNRVPWPPLFGAAALALAFFSERAYPLPLHLGPGGRWLGWALIAAGLGVDLWAMATMVRARVNILPHRAADGLVTSGPFAFTRNPIYLGNTVALAGIGVAVVSPAVCRRRDLYGQARRDVRDLPRGAASRASLRPRAGSIILPASRDGSASPRRRAGAAARTRAEPGPALPAEQRTRPPAHRRAVRRGFRARARRACGGAEGEGGLGVRLPIAFDYREIDGDFVSDALQGLAQIVAGRSSARRSRAAARNIAAPEKGAPRGCAEFLDVDAELCQGLGHFAHDAGALMAHDLQLERLVVAIRLGFRTALDRNA